MVKIEIPSVIETYKTQDGFTNFLLSNSNTKENLKIRNSNNTIVVSNGFEGLSIDGIHSDYGILKDIDNNKYKIYRSNLLEALNTYGYNEFFNCKFIVVKENSAFIFIPENGETHDGYKKEIGPNNKTNYISKKDLKIGGIYDGDIYLGEIETSKYNFGQNGIRISDIEKEYVTISHSSYVAIQKFINFDFYQSKTKYDFNKVLENIYVWNLINTRKTCPRFIKDNNEIVNDYIDACGVYIIIRTLKHLHIMKKNSYSNYEISFTSLSDKTLQPYIDQTEKLINHYNSLP